MRQIIFQECSSRRFGVELEVSNNLSKKQIGAILSAYETVYGNRTVTVSPGSEGWAATDNNPYWHVKFDRTCGPKGKDYDSGWEIASFIASGLKDARHIAKAAKFLVAFGVETNLNCGLHIHVETADFTCRNMAILLARWLKIEDLMLDICHPSRTNNVYCKSLRTKTEERGAEYISTFPNFFWNYMIPNDLGPHNNLEKRYTLNPIGFTLAQVIGQYHRNTIELRLPECTLDESHIENWIKLYVNFVEASLRADPPKDIEPVKSVAEALVYLGLQETDCFSILEPDLQDCKLWFLKKLAKSTKVWASREANATLEFISQV